MKASAFLDLMAEEDAAEAAAASDDKTARIWDAESGEAPRTLEGHTSSVWSAAFSPDGKRIVSASDDKTVRIWDAETGKELHTLLGHTDAVSSVAFSPDGKRIVSASSDNSVRIWDAESGEALRTLEGHTGEVYSAAFSPDGKRIVSASGDNSVRIWDAGSGETLRTVEKQTREVRSAAFSPDGKRIVSASKDNSVRIWDAESGEALRTLEGHTRLVMSAAFSPDGKRIVSASGDKTARIWDAESGEALRTVEGHTGWVRSAAFSPDGKRIVSASWDKTVRIWDAENGEALRTLEGHTNSVFSAAFSPDGKRIVSASDKTVRIWDAESEEAPRTLKGHTNAVNSAAFSPDGKRIVSASYDESVRIWDLEAARRNLGPDMQAAGEGGDGRQEADLLNDEELAHARRQPGNGDGGGDDTPRRLTLEQIHVIDLLTGTIEKWPGGGDEALQTTLQTTLRSMATGFASTIRHLPQLAAVFEEDVGGRCSDAVTRVCKQIVRAHRERIAVEADRLKLASRVRYGALGRKNKYFAKSWTVLGNADAPRTILTDTGSTTRAFDRELERRRAADLHKPDQVVHIPEGIAMSFHMRALDSLDEQLDEHVIVLVQCSNRMSHDGTTTGQFAWPAPDDDPRLCAGYQLLQMIVVEPRHFEQFKTLYGDTHMILRLRQNSMGIGYARWQAQLYLQERCASAWMIDDSVPDFVKTPVKPKPFADAVRVVGPSFKSKIEKLMAGKSTANGDTVAGILTPEVLQDYANDVKGSPTSKKMGAAFKLYKEGDMDAVTDEDLNKHRSGMQAFVQARLDDPWIGKLIHISPLTCFRSITTALDEIQAGWRSLVALVGIAKYRGSAANGMTNEQLEDFLDEIGIDYKSNSNKDVLEGLLDQACGMSSGIILRFVRKYASSAFFINLKLLKKEGLHFDPSHTIAEDIVLSQRCELRGLNVLRTAFVASGKNAKAAGGAQSQTHANVDAAKAVRKLFDVDVSSSPAISVRFPGSWGAAADETLADAQKQLQVIRDKLLNPALTALDLSSVPLESGDLEKIAGCHALTSLDISKCGDKVDDAALAAIAKGCPGLVTLSAKGCYSLRNVDLHTLTRLTCLDLSGSSSLTALDLSGLTVLAKLGLSDCSSVTSLDGLSGLTALTSLDLRRCGRLLPLGDLSELTALETFYPSACSSVGSLRDLPALTTLAVFDCSSPTFLDGLSRLTALTKLGVADCSGLTSLGDISRLTELTTLMLGNCGRLASVDLSGLTALTVFSVLDCSSLASLSGLSGLTALTSLDLRRCGSLSSHVDLRELTALAKVIIDGCSSLASLDLSGLTALTDLTIVRCPALKSLNISDCGDNVNADALEAVLNACPELTITLDGVKFRSLE